MINKSVMKKRSQILCIFFAILFFSCSVRIADIQNRSYSDVADMQFSRSLTLAKTRGYIYDRNMVPLVNTVKNNKTVYIKEVYPEIKAESNNVGNGLIISSAADIATEDTEYLKNYYNVSRYSDEQLCTHIIGYVNSEGFGVSGIEKAFDRLLNEAAGTLKAKYGADASGKALAGKGIELVNENFDSPAGIITTIDSEIQYITEKALEKSDISEGAAVVMDVNSFEIIAIASVPEFDPANAGIYLDDDTKPFLNRALNAYPAGSVIKPFIAAAAIENGWDHTSSYYCNGYINIGSNTFRCFNSNSHKNEDLNSAIENSCNTFFVDIGLKTGADKITEALKSFGFGNGTEFCSALYSAKGNIPDASSVTSDSQLATLCFGQGEILVTPVQLAAAYCTLANGGTYKEPILMKELIDDNGSIYGYYKSEISYRAVKSKTCEIINTTLYNNMLNGTGEKGSSMSVTSGGKTATAQTGRFNDNGKEVLCTWFAGFFPYENPVYTVVILNENGSTASIDCAPVFKEIIEGITLIRGVQQEF